jgi:GNAT superfamily N-acetyltransferase
LHLSATTRGDDEIFRAFFEGYDKAFVLPSEKEDESGFRACLSLNCGQAYASLQARYGAFRELCLVASAAQDGPIIGGANFIAMPLPSLVASQPAISANLNYIYVRPECRGRGMLRALVDGVLELIPQLFAWTSETQSLCEPAIVLLFIEQNDPFRMTPEQYRADSASAGVDQVDRLKIWSHLGARVVDFGYIQPALSDEQEPDRTLIYSVLGSPLGTITARTLMAHLRAFFGVSVLKGRAIADEPTADCQLKELEAACNREAEIALLDPAPVFARLQREPLQNLLSLASSFREAIHHCSR